MKRFYSYFLIVLSIIFFAACHKDNETNTNNTPTPPEPSQATIELLSSDIISFDNEGNCIDGTIPIKFKSSTAWSATSDQESWCIIKSSSGPSGDNNSISLSIQKYNGLDDRFAKITISAGSAIPKEVTVIQKPKGALTITRNNYQFDSKGNDLLTGDNKLIIKLKTNIDNWSYTIEGDADEWIIASQTNTRAMVEHTLEFRITENSKIKSREGKITIKAGSIEETLTIFQEGSEPSLILSKSEYHIDHNGGEIPIIIKGNIEDLDISIPEQIDWLTKKSSDSSDKFIIQVAPWDGDNARDAIVTIFSNSIGISSEIIIIQAPKDAIVIAKDTYNISNEEETIKIVVQHNVDFDIEISENAKDWISQTTTRALTETDLFFTIAANPGDSDRDGTITFISQKDQNCKQIVKIHQTQKNGLILNETDINIDDKTQDIEFTVRSNIDFDVIDPSVDWLHREITRAMTSQTIRYRVDANSDYNSRTATITVQSKDGSLKETITVTQAQKDAIVIAPSSITVDNDGGEIDIEVGHNIDFDIDISDSWITNTTTRAFETETLTFNIAANTSNDGREGTIKFISKDKSITQTVKVYQSQSNALIVSKKDIVIDEKAQSVEFEVRANVEYIVGEPSAKWLRRVTTRAMTSQTITFDVDANSGYNSREAKIIVQSKDGSLKETITVTQSQKDAIVVAPETIQVDNEGEEFEIEVGHNVDFDIEISHDWITTAATRAFETETLTFVVAANPTEDARQGTIKFISKDKSITQTITVVQMFDTTEPRNNEIWYTSTDGNIVTPNATDVFGANIVSNTYENGKGIITFDGNVTEIGYMAFQKCSSLTSVTIPDSVTSIGDWAFARCNSLTTISISDSVTEIGYWAFYGCSSLKVFYGKFSADNGRCLVNGSTIIAYAEASGTTYTIPDSVTEIGEYAFSYCSSLTSITIPNSVTSIGGSAFLGCRSLTSITIPDSVTEIGEYAFSYCSSLTSITIPYSVTEIGSYSFEDCSSLKAFYGKFATSDNKALIVNGTLNAFAIGCGATSYTIPDSVTTIGTYAFYNCSSLTTITIPDSVTLIGGEAFYNCSSLTSVTIGNSVTEIGSGAFADCSSLTNITIPDSVIEIGYGAFYDCYSLTTITIPDSVTLIVGEAFYNCSSLKSVYCKPTTPPNTRGTSVFTNNASDRKIYVPEKSLDAYKNADGWKEYADAIVVDPATESKPKNNEIWYYTNDNQPIEKNIWTNPNFFGNTSIITNTYSNGKGVITFTREVTKIGGQAFAQNNNLTRIVLPESVTSIEGQAFNGCLSLVDIKIPEAVTSIGKSAFASCTKLPEIVIPQSVTEIKERTFEKCESLTEITIPAGVTSVESYAFDKCTKLKAVHCLPIVPPTAKRTYWNAFSNNASNRKIYVPKNSVETYRKADGWSYYGDDIVAEESGKN